MATSKKTNPSGFTIQVQRNESSYPIVYGGEVNTIINAYTKGEMYCVLFEKDGKRITHKFPTSSLFRVVEDYEGSKR